MRPFAERLILALLCWTVSGAAVPPVAAETILAIPCRVTAVSEPCRVEVAWQGSTHTVRLAEIDCPTAGSEWGERSLRATRLLVGDEGNVELRVEESRPGRPIVGTILLSGDQNLGRELVGRGLAWADRGTDPPLPEILAAEGAARSARRGIWGDPNGPRPGEDRPGSRPSISITGPVPAPSPPSSSPTTRRPGCRPRSECCKVCSKGKACGNSCISASYTCRKGRGCACNASEICR